MMLIESRTRALQQKQNTLTQSLEAWLELTAGKASRKDPAFEIHYHQTREVDQIMEGLRQTTLHGIAKAVSGGEVRRKVTTIETTILAACQVWEFFRGRFAQRLDPGVQVFLRVADELAWQCYQPVRDFAFGKNNPLCKAPPLVYLNSTWSPFVVVRGKEYEAEAVPRAFTQNVDFQTALSRMPFPIVAVPWYQTVYLPDAVSICHEVGHAVEADCGLQNAIGEAIAAAIPDPVRADFWKTRGSELFADYFGCLCVGIAYPWALATMTLADSDSLVRAKDLKYPSPYARLLFNARVVHGMGFATASSKFVAEWEPIAAGGPVDSNEVEEICRLAAHFLGDIGSDSAGITLRDPTGKTATLRELIGLTDLQQQEVEAEVEALRRGEAASSSDIRVLFAAAAIMWRDTMFAAQPQLLKVMRQACVDERRNNEARLDMSVTNKRAEYLNQIGALLAMSLLDTSLS
jgi:hypothetical protein